MELSRPKQIDQDSNERHQRCGDTSRGRRRSLEDISAWLEIFAAPVRL